MRSSLAVPFVVVSQLAACAVPAVPESDSESESESDPEAESGEERLDEAGRRAPFQLRVSLYPWIPEPEAFLAWIEADFEAKHPGIDLVVRALVKSYDWEPGYVADLAYEPEKTIEALTDAAGDDFQHLIEVDTMILGGLAEANAIAPFRVAGSFLPAAREAVRWGGESHGVPHWTCGNFVISEDPAVRRARDVDALVATLAGAGTARPDLVGDLGGSWGTISTYLDAFHDTYPAGDMRAELSAPALDPVVAGRLVALRAACEQGGVNRCGDDGVDAFATGGADALIGFSERLNPVLGHPGRTVGALHIASAPLGDGDHPTAFVDALVLSPECTARCRRAARAFARYYVSDETFEVALMALDAGTGVPRYLLPSTRSSFDYGLVGHDRLYRQLEREIRGARAFPNAGAPEARAAGVIRAQVEAALGL